MYRFHSIQPDPPCDARFAMRSLPAADAVQPWKSDVQDAFRVVSPVAADMRKATPAARHVEWIEEDPERWDGLS